jgi:hypothetical protein
LSLSFVQHVGQSISTKLFVVWHFIIVFELGSAPPVDRAKNCFSPVRFLACRFRRTRTSFVHEMIFGSPAGTGISICNDGSTGS